MSAIDLNNYNSLETYAVLANNSITGTSSTTVTVVNGYFGTVVPGGVTPSGSVVGSGSPSGEQDGVPALAAKQQLGDVSTHGTLIGDITAYTASLTFANEYNHDGGSITVQPNLNYVTVETPQIYNNCTMEFDGGSVPNAQFFITSTSSMIFSNVVMSLLGTATASNIFILAENSITFIGSSTINGNFISKTGNISFDTSAVTVNSHIYTAGSSISFDGSTTVNNPGPLVCYVKGTNILTSKGYVKIEDLTVGDKV